MSGLSVSLQILQACLGFIDRWNMPRFYPPDRVIRFAKALEPGFTLPHHVGMRTAEDELPEVVRRFPNGQVHQYPVVVIGAQRCCIAFIGFQAPDETGTDFGERIDIVQPGDKTRHHRVIHRCQRTRDVDLGEMKLSGHAQPFFFYTDKFKPDESISYANLSM
jgi:hypothetical protein